MMLSQITVPVQSDPVNYGPSSLVWVSFGCGKSNFVLEGNGPVRLDSVAYITVGYRFSRARYSHIK